MLLLTESASINYIKIETKILINIWIEIEIEIKIDSIKIWTKIILFKSLFKLELPLSKPSCVNLLSFCFKNVQYSMFNG